MRKYIFNGAMLGVILGGWGMLRTTKKGPRDWRLGLMWLSWVVGAVAAVDAVVTQARARQIDA